MPEKVSLKVALLRYLLLCTWQAVAPRMRFTPANAHKEHHKPESAFTSAQSSHLKHNTASNADDHVIVLTLHITFNLRIYCKRSTHLQ
jgi:hypothetical protein